ncbi:MAG TPA: methyl-accepting chemotaxis protein, partial [Smithellaceae bacterium]|nr:methyl-accepting chemotaxis protein [Smithellaceae bacterium]
YYGLKSQNNSLEDIFNIRYKMSVDSLKIKSDIISANTLIYKAISFARADYAADRINEQIKEHMALIENSLKSLEQSTKNPVLTAEEKKFFSAALEKLKEYKAVSFDLGNMITADVNAATMVMDLLENKYKVLEKAIFDLMLIEDKMSREKYDFSAKNFKFVLILFLIIATLAIVLTIITNFLIARLATSEINKTMSAVSRVAEEGDLTVAISVTSSDEIGQLANSVETMRTKMEDAVGQASLIAGKLAESSSEGAASIEETSASLSEISNMIGLNAKNTSEVNGLMSQAEKEIQNANNQMKNLTSSMNEIAAASERAQKIVKNIDEIAFQTNLLALNAAVEAARAGEAGAGFAVVADEVRNLAMRATESAKNTAGLITDIVTSIKQGNEMVNTTSEVFEQVLTSTNTVVGLMEHITTASQEQTQGIDQINKAVQQMNIVTQQNAGSAEELAASMATFRTRQSVGSRPKKIFATEKKQQKALPSR